jgi:hypothetical protein
LGNVSCLEPVGKSQFHILPCLATTIFEEYNYPADYVDIAQWARAAEA